MSKKYDNGRARLYPMKKIPGSLKKTSTPKKIESRIDGISQSPVAGFKIHTSNDRANFELEKMRIELNDGVNASDELATEQGPVSAIDKGSTSQNDDTVKDASEQNLLVVSPPEKKKKRERSNSVL